jgi:hypothetical protein
VWRSGTSPSERNAGDPTARIERARAASAQPRRPVEVLISLCGFAATPTVLTYELLRPRRLVVITSRDAPDSVDLIGQRLVGPDRLRFQDFRHVAVDAGDPLDMYQSIALELAGADGRHAVIDITGGRKVMSGGCGARQLAAQPRAPLHREPVRPGDPATAARRGPADRTGQPDDALRRAGTRPGAGDVPIGVVRGSPAAVRRDRRTHCRARQSPADASAGRAVPHVVRSRSGWGLPAAIGRVEAAQRRGRREVTEATSRTIERQLAFVRQLAAGDAVAGWEVGEYVRCADFDYPPCLVRSAHSRCRCCSTWTRPSRAVSVGEPIKERDRGSMPPTQQDQRRPAWAGHLTPSA